MRILVLGHGKTGKLVADIAHERGHGVHVLDAKENRDATALTPPFVAGFDIVIDFTTPEAVVQNMRACLATGARMVIGTTGWYHRLPDMRALTERRNAGLLFATNFSVGVQTMLRLAAEMSRDLAAKGYQFHIEETHHATKLDAPSGTAVTLRETVEHAGRVAEVPIHSHREADVAGNPHPHRRERRRPPHPHPHRPLPPRLRRGRRPRRRVARPPHRHLRLQRHLHRDLAQLRPSSLKTEN